MRRLWKWLIRGEGPSGIKAWVGPLVVAVLLSGASTYLLWRSEPAQQSVRKSLDEVRAKAKRELDLERYERAIATLPEMVTSPKSFATQRMYSMTVQVFALAALFWIVLSILLVRSDVGYGQVLPIVARSTLVLAAADVIAVLLTYLTGQFLAQPFALAPIVLALGSGNGVWAEHLATLNVAVVVWLVVLAAGFGDLFQVPKTWTGLVLVAAYVVVTFLPALLPSFGGHGPRH